MSETLHPGSKSAPISEPFFSAYLLEQLKAQLDPLLFAAVSVKFNSYEYELQHAQMKVQVLEERLRQQRIAKYGPGSETLSNLQLELLDLEPGVSNAEVAAESLREALLSSSDEKKKRGKHPGRQTLPADLPRVEKIIACTAEQCKCGREGPARLLDKFAGMLQTDGYVAYDRGVGSPKMVHAACWSHARRQFVDAIKLNKQDAASISIVELMDKLFAIDARARDEKTDHTARHALRRQEAPPLLEKIREQILQMSRNVLPKSAAGKACSYTLTLWKRLECFLDYPELIQQVVV